MGLSYCIYLKEPKKPQNTSLKVGSVPGKIQISLFQIKTRGVFT
jgi:hypothetical protein